MTKRPLWVIGSGGFLGSGLLRVSTESGYENFLDSKISWTDPLERKEDLRVNASRFFDFTQGAQGTIIWSAGQGGVTAQGDKRTSEISAFLDFVKVLENFPELFGSQIVICSSAGGAYGGSQSPPFTLSTIPIAINPYGQEKLHIEEVAAKVLLAKYRVLIARITNLYGAWPGSRQGLVNRLCTAAVTREPIQIYVSLDTVRDYIDVEDAASIILLEAAYARDQDQRGIGSLNWCLVGSGVPTSVGDVMTTVTSISRKKVPISLADLEYKNLQPRDLRVLPTWIEHGINYSPVSLPTGVKRLVDSLVTQPRWD